MTLSLSQSDDTALRLPVGAASPLWLLFGGAAVAGAAFYWAARWLRAEPAAVEAPVTPRPEPEVEAAAQKVLSAPEPELEVEPLADPQQAASPQVAAADDLTRLTGIGPKLAAALTSRGVTRFAQIAAWTDEEIAVLDREMRLMGRIAREAWVAQALRLSAG
jgi:predicted flap endonuclease-1-like 5' DNA nuclease